MQCRHAKLYTLTITLPYAMPTMLLLKSLTIFAYCSVTLRYGITLVMTVFDDLPIAIGV